MKKVDLHVHAPNASWVLKVHPTSANRAIQEFRAQQGRVIQLDVEVPSFIRDNTQTRVYYFNSGLIVTMFIEPETPF